MNLKIINFSSPTCSICTNQDSILQELKNEHDITYQSLLITTNFSDALKFGVKSAPTLIYLIDNKAVAVRPGFQSKVRILAEIEKISKSLST
jgi:thioredoxin-like negative regulator of GroEL